MKALRILRYLTLSALRSFRTSWVLQTITVVTIATTFVILGGIYLLVDNVRDAFAESRGGIHVSVYFKPGGDAKALSAVEKNFCAREFVAKCAFRSSSDAKERFLEDNPGLEEAVAALDENPFPASVEIDIRSAFREPALLAAFSKGLANIEGVEAVDDGGDWSARWISFLNLLDGVLWVLVVSLGLAAMFIVANTIRLVVFSRRDEVGILSLVGATDFFIRLPFVIEGFLQGLLGASLALGLLRVLFHFIDRIVRTQWEGFVASSLHFLSPSAQAVLLLFGVAIGLAGSLAAVSRHLRV